MASFKHRNLLLVRMYLILYSHNVGLHIRVQKLLLYKRNINLINILSFSLFPNICVLFLGKEVIYFVLLVKFSIEFKL